MNRHYCFLLNTVISINKNPSLLPIMAMEFEFITVNVGRKDSVSRDLRARSSAALDSPPDCQVTTASPSSPFFVCTNEKQIHRKCDGLVFGRERALISELNTVFSIWPKEIVFEPSL